jgi:hypothetical protein
MTQRMNKEVRRERLLVIMRAHYAQAETISDFSVKNIATEEGVSEVWMYQLIGEEFEALRRKLLSKPPAETPEDKLRRENAQLRCRVSDLEEMFQIEITGDYAEAIKIIEAQDEEIRALNGLLRLYKKRLAEHGLLVELGDNETNSLSTQGEENDNLDSAVDDPQEHVN